MPSNILKTAMGTISISDSLLTLMADFFLTGDIHAAAQHFTQFKFDQNRDPEFYRDSWWRLPEDVQLAGARKVVDKFNSWYRQAPDIERTFIAIAGLTDSSEQLENIVHDAYRSMQDKFQIAMQDCDGAHFHIDDYHAMRLDDNLNAAIFTERNEWWCRRFEEQAHRVMSSPCIPWEQFVYWNNRREEQEHYLTQRFRTYRRADTGLSQKKMRRVFNKSLSLFTRMYGENNARKFLHGKNLWIHGKHFVWKLKLDERRDILRNTVTPSNVHTPFRISICDHDLVELCHACVLFDETPVLDQAVAFGLIMAHEADELDFLRKTNLFTFTEKGRENQLLISMPNANVMQYYRRLDPDPIGADDECCDDPYADPEPEPVYDASDLNPDEVDWGESYYDYTRFMRFQDEVPPNSDYASAYSSEYDDPIQPFVSAASTLTDNQREGVMEHYRYWRIEQRNERYWRGRHPIMSLLREKLFSRLDVDPDLLRYMQFPEFHFGFLPKVLTAPRLEGWVSARVPLFEKGF